MGCLWQAAETRHLGCQGASFQSPEDTTVWRNDGESGDGSSLKALNLPDLDPQATAAVRGNQQLSGV